MKELPLEILYYIFKFQKTWWLKKNKELVNIEKLSRIHRPIVTLTFSKVVLQSQYILKFNLSTKSFEVMKLKGSNDRSTERNLASYVLSSYDRKNWFFGYII
jgi:hypothetical protein